MIFFQSMDEILMKLPLCPVRIKQDKNHKTEMMASEVRLRT